MPSEISAAAKSGWPSRKAFSAAVQEFLSGYAERLYRTKVEASLREWDFKQSSTEGNQEKRIAAETAYRDTASDAKALAILCGLIGDPRFRALDRRTRRALVVARRMYEENTAGPGDDPQFTSLRKATVARTIELERIKTVAGDGSGLGAKIPENEKKPFAELLRDLVVERNRLARMRRHPTFYHMCVAEAGLEFDGMQRLIADINDGITALLPRARHAAINGPEQLDINELVGRIADPSTMLQQTASIMGVEPSVLQAILAASDLFPRANKDSFWYAFPIDPPFDVRASANISVPPAKLDVNDVKGQLLHEVFGHGLDFRSINPDLPALLRDHDNFTAEAVAGLSEDLFFEPRWLKRVCALTDAEMQELLPSLQMLQLRWTLYALRRNLASVEFEIELYRDPMQDLDAAYAKATAPPENKQPSEMGFAAGDWATQLPHYISHPCYIHNYVMGDAWTSQVRQTLRKRFGSYASRRTGPFLKRHRRHGLVYTADEQMLRMTGEPLSAQALLAELNALTSSLEKAIEGKAAA